MKILRVQVHRATLFLLIIIGVLLPQIAFSQLLQGTLNGTVTDTGHASIPEATVTVVNDATSVTRTTTTGGGGDFSIVTLQPGTYTLTVSASGFQGYKQTGVVVKANEVAHIDVGLSVGGVTQSITVSSQAAALQTDRSDVHTDISANQLSSLPLALGRNYQLALAVVTPGVSPPQSSGSFSANPSRAVGYSVNGVSAVTNTTRIDGTSSTDYNAPDKPMYSPALEAIENINVVTNSPDAEQGIAGGAAVNLTTKTGTGQLHGSIFEYHTDQHLLAYSWIGNSTQPKPKYINNQFGGTIGGPLKKDKLFYFLSYQGTYVTIGTTLFAQNPTAAMKAGDLSASPTPIYDPATGNPDGSGRTPFPGNRIPTARIDPGVLAVLNFAPLPDPNTPGTGTLGLAQNYRSTGNSSSKQDQFDTKLFYNVNSKLSTFVRFGLNKVSWINPQQYGMLGGPAYSPSNTATGTGVGMIYSGTISATYIFTPHLIVDANYGYTRNNADGTQQLLDQNLGYTLLGIPGLQSSNKAEWGLPVLAIDGFGGTAANLPEATIGPANNFQPQFLRNAEKEYVGNLTFVKGSHNIRGGLDFTQQHETEIVEQATFCNYCAGSGGFQFSQGATQLKGGPAGNDYNAFASFLLGLPSNAGKVTLIPPQYREFAHILGAYVRDQWQVNRKLSLTFGTRWTYYPFADRGDRGMEYLDAASNRMIICGLNGIPKNCGITKNDKRFEPRVGAAYKINDTTVVRGGFGLSTDPTNIGGVLGNRQNYPDIVASTLTAPNSFSYATTLRTGLPPVVAPDYSSGSVAVPKTAGVFTVDNNTFVRGYIESFNVTLEQQMKGDWLTSIAYVGTRSINPISTINANWSPIGTGSAGQVLNVLSGRTGSTNTIGTFGNSKYDALQMRASHAFARGYGVTATYTFAKGIGYTSQVAIPSFYYLNRGNLSSLARHTVGVALTLSSPFGKNGKFLHNGIGDILLRGWQFQAISTLRSGTPFTVTASNTTLNAIGSNQFADCIGPLRKLRSVNQWYDKSAFANPTPGRFGTCPTNNLWGPGLINVDTGLARTFHLYERFNLEARGQLFNTSNTPHHANPTSSLTSSAFMQARGIANSGRDGIDQRTAQFSLRLSF
ncbi:TonB-dependent receptor [Edaphobacter modestus]|uniref:Carboxypeptidase family protein n=1 Tax=Edaphobacter modestus TaxID=388466 RepID=A0A4Q7XXG0_9BACT|nr:TonB-dependent receptor [Edaphobacter modestus]RZU29062.1 carboxypeptidase family protein [Edaphobacter modestus]